MSWTFPDSLELVRDYAALNPSGEHVVPAELDDMTVADLDRFVSDCMQLKEAAAQLQRHAKEAIIDRAGEPDRTGTRHAVNVGGRVYVHRETPSQLKWQNDREALEFLWDRGGAAAVLKAHRALNLRSKNVLADLAGELDIDADAFFDTFVGERPMGPKVELINLDSQYAPKWAGALPDVLDVEFDCG